MLELKNYIHQPNRVTNAKYSYSLVQEKIFNLVMFYLQQDIKQSMGGMAVSQMNLFRTQEDIKIPIAMKHIASPQQYPQVRESAKALVGIVVEMRDRHLDGSGEFIKWQGLFRSVEVSETKPSVLLITIDKQVAKWLVSVNQGLDGKPREFTGYYLEAANGGNNKYTSRIYKLICSWKIKGGFHMPIDELRENLCLGDKYTNFNGIKKSILDPVQKELKEISDIYFNYSEVKEGKKVTGINFKVLDNTTGTQSDKEAKLFYNLYDVIRKNFGMNDEQMLKLQPVLRQHSYQDVAIKVSKLWEYVNTPGQVKLSKAAYAFTSLINEFEA